MVTSPSTVNYQIGKGIVSFDKGSLGSFTLLGNVPEFEWTPAVDKLDHFSSQEGIKKKDKSVVISAGATLRMVMDEVTGFNLQMLALGTPTANSDGDTTIKSMELASIEGTIKFVGTNDVGLKVDFIGKVDFTPSGSFNMISDEWNTMEVTGEMVGDDTYGLGLWTIHDQGVTA